MLANFPLHAMLILGQLWAKFAAPKAPKMLSILAPSDG